MEYQNFLIQSFEKLNETNSKNFKSQRRYFEHKMQNNYNKTC